MADSVEKPPHMPIPTPREVSWRVRLRIQEACETYSVSAAKMKHAIIFEQNVAVWKALNTPCEAGCRGNSCAMPYRMAVPRQPPRNTTRYSMPSANGLNCARTRLMGASGICGGCSAAAAPVGCGVGCAYNFACATLISCVEGDGSAISACATSASGTSACGAPAV